MIEPGLGSIDKVPIMLLVAENDLQCPASYISRLEKEIPAIKASQVIPGASHSFFATTTSPDFVKLLTEQIETKFDVACEGADCPDTEEDGMVWLWVIISSLTMAVIIMIIACCCCKDKH